MTVSLDQARDAIRAIVRQNKLSGVVASLVVPVLVGVWAVFYERITGIKDIGQFLFWGPLTVFIVVGAIATYGIYDVQLAPEVYVEAVATREQIRDLEMAVASLSEVQEHSLVLMAAVQTHLGLSQPTAATLKSLLASVCDLIASNRDAFFGMDQRELWAFSIYLANPKDGLLYPVWRIRHPRHPGRAPSRVWAPGCGHIGIAFAHRQTKICGDASVPGIWETVSGPEERPYDRVVYASFASQPIDAGEGDRPFGVLTATSDSVGRFDVGTSLVLRHAAKAIAMIIQLKYTENNLAEVCENVDTTGEQAQQ
jgi:hypothetical protein